MPGKIKVKVLAGRNLPVMDRASDTTDAFVEIKFGGVTHKTDVCRKSLNPHWSTTEWYRFEVDESELQDEPLQLRLMDHDTYSANDAIGKVVISLAPLLAREANNAKGTTGPPGGAVLSGWIPVFDTMHGIRGELNVIVKVELFSDFNKYKTSSCGVQFFHCPMIPPGYKATSIHGFVEELVVNDDPEYQWIDKIRTPRASNEARQVAFIKLSNQVQRLVGLKAAELGANAVVGYQQEFDLEGEAGVVARAIGTAVSISPLPTPSQPVNVIPCSQQQLKKCLDILATDDESVTDLSQYYRTHQDELQKMIHILNPRGLSMLDSQENPDNDDEKIELVRQSSLNSYAGSASLYQDNYISHRSLRHLSEDQTDLNRLLNQKNEDESSSSEGPIEKIKKLKTNFFTKRFTKRKGDKQREKQDDCISIKSNSSDTSRISLIDIKNEFKKFKRLKKPKIFLNKEDEGEGMASILARSVIHARTSLACIAETQDSENSPSSTLRRTSESEPNVNVSDDDNTIVIEKVVEEKVETDDKKVPEIHFTSLKNITSEDMPDHEPRVRRLSESCPTSPIGGRSDNLLKLPGDVGYFGSISSALSGESSLFSSSEDEEESSDLRTDTDDAFETTSSIVQSVMKHETDPALIAQMDKKLSILQNSPPKIAEIVLANFDVETSPPIELTVVSELDKVGADRKETNMFEKAEEDVLKNGPSVIKEAETCVPKPNSHFIKLHNPFAHRKAATSISCPSSPVEKHNFVYRSSKRIKDKLAKISKSHMIKSISHISLFPRKRHESKTLSQPGSSSDMGSKCPSKYPSETVLGSHFLSYSDLLGLDKNTLESNKLCKSDEIGRSKFSMYIGSEPCSRASLSGPSFPHKEDYDHHRKRSSLKPTSLVHTAMETMLIDKVQSLLIPTSPEPDSVNTKFFNDVSERLEEHKNAGLAMGHLQSTVSSTTPRIVAVTPKRLSEDYTAKVPENQYEDKKIECLTQARTESSINKVQATNSIIMESIHTTYPLQDEADKDKHLVHRKKDIKGSISTLIDKIHIPHPHFFHHKKDDSSPDIKSGGLFQTAMQTILIDKAQVMMPDTPEPIPIRADPDFGEFGKHHRQDHTHDKEKESTGLVHSALSTMLIDNVQSVLPEGSDPIPIHTEPIFDGTEIRDHDKTKEKDSTGLVYSALQTMLIDNVQSVLPDTLEPVPINMEQELSELEHKYDRTKDKEPTGLVRSALQTMLIDNVQCVLPGTHEPIFIHTEPNIDDKKSLKDDHLSFNDKPSTGLVHSALLTMLLDNVQSVLPNTQDPTDINLNDTNSFKSNDPKDEDSKELIQSALETILIDNVQVVLPTSAEPIPINLSNEAENDSLKCKDSPYMESNKLVNTALQTTFLENIKSVFPGTSEPVPINLNSDAQNEKTNYDETKHTDVVHFTLETINKVHDLVTPTHINLSESKDIDVPEIYIANKEEQNKDLDLTAIENVIIDRIQTVFPKDPEVDLHDRQVKNNNPPNETENKPNPLDSWERSPGILDSNKKSIVIGEAQPVLDISTEKHVIKPKSPKLKRSKSNNKEKLKLKGSSGDTSAESFSKQSESSKALRKPKKDVVDITKIKRSSEDRRKDLVRQDSIHSVTSIKMSEETNTPCKAPVLQHFHPILSGPKTQLEIIPSTECSIERSVDDETNSASVCDNSHAACRVDRSERDRDVRGTEKGSPRHARHESCGGRDPPQGGSHQNSSLNASSTPMGIHRRSSDSDLSITPKGGSLNTSVGNNVGSGGGAILRPSMNSNNLDMLEYPFLTMTEYPPGFIVHIGGAVCARSVKLVDGGGESAARAAWWAELRTELRAHARALRCNAVIAYRDTAAICEDVCVLSASGTAAVINLDCDFNADLETSITVSNGPKLEDAELDSCSIAHVPYSPGAGPYRAELSICGSCRRARVPAVLLAACAKPNRLTAYPKAVNLTAVAARVRRAAPTSEPGARDISDQLPFLEYELHKLLLAKLRMQGANALFSLQTQIAIGERCVMALASGTACKLTALPPPTAPRIKASEKEKDALEMQKALWDTFTANKAANGYDVSGVAELAANGALPEVDREELPPVLDLCADKDACVLELDEAEDVETARALAKRRIHIQAFTNSLKPAPGVQPLAFTQVSRARVPASSGVHAGGAAERQVARALAAAAYKLRRLAPLALHVAFQLELPEDEIQLVVSGTALPLAGAGEAAARSGSRAGSHSDTQTSHSSTSQNNSQDDEIFELEEEQLLKPTLAQELEDKSAVTGQTGSFVSLTTLSQVGSGRVMRRLCALRLLFVRETTAVRELGGLSGFLHTFTCEVLAILRAYTAALGGNALTSFYITQLMLQDNAHKNQGQCLLSVGGDVVHVSY